VLTQPEVKGLAKKFYDAQLPNRAGGRLGFKELRHAFRALNESLGLPLPTMEVANQLFRRFDFNGDNCLSQDEFYELFVASLRRVAFDKSTLLGRDVFVSKEKGKVWDNYDCMKKLGTGSFGAAYLCKHKRSGEERVVKAAGKSQVKLPIEDVEREIMVMTELDHPHIVKLYEWYEGNNSIYLVLDPLHGGTLQEVVLLRQRNDAAVPEEWFRQVMHQCIEAMAYCHDKRIIHKDLKDENIMLLKKDPDYMEPHAVIIDLGVSEMFGSTDTKGKTMAGTPTTMAPEVWTGSFGPKCDVWSLGCVLFEILAGEVPFIARSFDPKDWRALHKRGPRWEKVRASKSAIDLCSNMLKFEEKERPTMATCAKHQWFNAQAHTLQVLPPSHFERLQQFAAQSALKRGVMLEIASRLPMQHAEKVVRIFKAFDESGDGAISKQELASGLKRVGVKDPKSIDNVFQVLDIDGDGFLSLHEFTAGVLMMFTDLVEERFRALFRKYDRDANGTLDRDEVAEFVAAASQLVAKTSRRTPEEVVQGILDECGDTLTYEEAKKLLLVASA